MNEASEFHADLTKELTNALQRFHELHPDLFIQDVRICSSSDNIGRKILIGLTIDIMVQPKGYEKVNHA